MLLLTFAFAAAVLIFPPIVALALFVLAPVHLLWLAVAIAAAFSLGYAFRGSIRKDVALATSEAGQLATRLEDALRTDEHALAAEAEKIIAYLRARLPS